MFFLIREAHINPLFKDFNFLKLHDKIALENSIFIHKSFKHHFSNHLITGFDFPQISIPATQGGRIWAALMYLLTELTCMKETLFVLVHISHGIISKIFKEMIYFISLPQSA